MSSDKCGCKALDRKASFGSLDLILPQLLPTQLLVEEKKKINQDSSIQFSSLPQKAIYVEMEPSQPRNNTLYTIHNVSRGCDGEV